MAERYKATKCDDGKWMVHDDGDIICFAEEHDAEAKAQYVTDALNNFNAIRQIKY